MRKHTQQQNIYLLTNPDSILSFPPMLKANYSTGIDVITRRSQLTKADFIWLRHRYAKLVGSALQFCSPL